MMPTKTIPAIKSEVAIGKRMNGSEMLIAMSVRARCQLGCLDLGTRNQPILAIHHDLLPFCESVADDSFANAGLADLDGLYRNLIVGADYESEQTVGAMLNDTLRHDDRLFQCFNQCLRRNRQAGIEGLIVVLERRFHADGAGRRRHRIVDEGQMSMRQDL